MTFRPLKFVSLLGLLIPLAAAGEDAPKRFTGPGAQNDWTNDAPGVTRLITPADLPAPYATAPTADPPHVVKRPAGAELHTLPGFKVEVYAEGFKNPRFLITAPNGDIFVTESKTGEVRVLRDSGGKPALNQVFVSGLSQPFGVAFYPPGPDPKYIYVANTDSVVRFPYKNGDLKTDAAPEKIADLSGGGKLRGGGHWTRDIVFSKDGKKLYASVGSKSNDDEKADPIESDRARIWQMNPDGSDRKVFAYGIRNPVGIAIHPETGDLWMSTNERDNLGDNLVPDYISRVKEGGFYGWPWFYIGDHQDPRHAGEHPELADKIAVPDVLVSSHSASLNLAFYTGSQFPAEYHDDVFAAFHGSWNRSRRTGSKIVRVHLKDGVPSGDYEDFVTGFVTPAGEVWGRAVGLTVAKDGSLLFSEDGANTIWRVSYQAAAK